MQRKSKLKFEEYQVIYKKHEKDGWGVRKMSRYLGRSPSTISRFLRKNTICALEFGGK